MQELACPPLGPRPFSGPTCCVVNVLPHSGRLARAGQFVRWRFFLAFLFLSALGLALSGCGGSASTATTTSALEISPNSLNFGSVSVGKTVSANVSIVNLSSSSVQISAFSVTGNSFSVTPQGTLPLTVSAGGGSLTVSVQFTPTLSGNASGYKQRGIGPDQRSQPKRNWPAFGSSSPQLADLHQQFHPRVVDRFLFRQPERGGSKRRHGCEPDQQQHSPRSAGVSDRGGRRNQRRVPGHCFSRKHVSERYTHGQCSRHFPNRQRGSRSREP
jgi:Abnormal spindle-like microcephaly-assoc'd, ASPM-SPD-2-Hydin